jgi:23S rRNA G2445 N2-methylase RlmL
MRIRSANSLLDEMPALRRSSRPPIHRRSGTVHHRPSGILGTGSDRVAGGADSASGNGARRGSGARTGEKRGTTKSAPGQARPRPHEAEHRRRGHRLGSDRTRPGQRAAIGAEIHATDISAEALEVARANAARHELTSRIEFRQADLLAGFSPASFDIVVSNPPYVGESEEDSVQLEVRKFEPRNAVFAGATGVEVIERLIPQALQALIPADGWCSRSAERLLTSATSALGLERNRDQKRSAGNRAGGDRQKKHPLKQACG